MNRRLFEQKNSYEEAKVFMESSKHLSPAYFILGGVDGNDGCIISTTGIYGNVANLPNVTLDGGWKSYAINPFNS